MTHPRITDQLWITFGNPNHYDGSGLMLRELRARCRDADMEPHQKTSIEDMEAEFKANYGYKLTEAEAVRHNYSDIIADLLSDMAPEGFVFEIRKNNGNSNYGYFLCWDRESVHAELQKHYGDSGIFAAESSCLVESDYAQGYEHCLDKILPALEEELSYDGN
jgi:hypothetical protein